MAGYRLGFDIGGTFTDLALLEPESGNLEIHKVLTTPDDPARGSLQGIAEFLSRLGVEHGSVAQAIHATTLVANALIERSGARIGLLTTRGFRDTLEIGNEQRYDIYDLFLRYPEPLVPRRLRRGVRERVDRDGRVLERLDELAVRAVLEDWRREGVEAVAVCFLHAYRNPANEEAARRIIGEVWPGVPVSLSSQVASEIREYERTSTTVANAYVQPLMARYLARLERALRGQGFRGGFYPMLSSGSIAPLQVAIDQPIRLVESGPAAGAILAAHHGELAGYRDVLSFDMGGTTAKLCLIQNGRPSLASALEAARIHRFKKGSGFPLRIPAVDMLEIGAGGGSIAWIDALGLMKVGPQSAGAQPGPACYGFGGTEPTVTDADVVLGYLNPDYFLGGEMSLDADAAWQAVETVGSRLGLSAVEAADGIHRLVNENMAAAARIHVIEKAEDPRRFVLICFGGAGPVHAAGVARIVGSRSVIVPFRAGVASALGLLLAPTAFEFVRSFPGRLKDVDWTEVEGIFQEMEARGRELLREAGADGREPEIERSVDARFEGQLHEIRLRLAGDIRDPDPGRLEARFREEYRRLYRHLPGEMPIEFLTWRARVAAPAEAPDRVERGLAPQDAARALKARRRAYFSELGGFVETPVYDRYDLEPGMRLSGPALVEERECTLVVRPGMEAQVDASLNMEMYAR